MAGGWQLAAGNYPQAEVLLTLAGLMVLIDALAETRTDLDKRRTRLAAEGNKP